MEALLFDLDGVVYQGARVIDGALETVAWCERRGLPHMFVTNTTSKPRRAVVERLDALGLRVSADSIMAPPAAAHDYLMRNATEPVALFVRESTREDFEGLTLLDDSLEEGAAAVVIGDIGAEWDFSTLNRAFRLLMAEPKPTLIALGMSRYAQGDDGLVLDVAPFIRALEHAASCEAVVMGKPAAHFFEACVTRLGVSASSTVMIGDDVRGDVGGAQAAGLRGILVRTGKFRPHDLEGDVRPDAVLDSIAEVRAWWEAQDS